MSRGETSRKTTTGVIEPTSFDDPQNAAVVINIYKCVFNENVI